MIGIVTLVCGQLYGLSPGQFTKLKILETQLQERFAASFTGEADLKTWATENQEIINRMRQLDRPTAARYQKQQDDLTKKVTPLQKARKTGQDGVTNIIESFSALPQKMAVTEEQRQKLAEEQDGIDLISTDDITKEPLDKLMILGGHLFLKKTIIDHMISKVASKEGILDPFTQQPISTEIQHALLEYFSLPIKLLEKGGPIYEDVRDLQMRENWIVMTGEPETEKAENELKELEDEAAEFRKRIRDTLARYNYSSTE